MLDDGTDGEPSYVTLLGRDRARELAAASRTSACVELLAAIDGDTVELAELTELIARRSA